jgi:homopolymeric O-antigen transport system permease protein
MTNAATESEPAQFEIRIRPNQNWLRIDLRALWEFRDLLALLVRRDFVARYQQTALGPAWAIVQPLAMTLVFTLVFGKFAGISTDGLPPILFYLCSLLAWNYHAQTFQLTAGTFTTNAELFGKVYFPRLVVPFSIALSNLIAFLIEAAIFAIIWCYYKFFTGAGGQFGADARALLAPLLLLQVAAVSVGAGLIVASCTAKYRDLRHVLPLLVQVWLYLTPVIYPLSKVPARWQWAMALNPVAPVIEMMRYLLLGRGEVHADQCLWSVAIAAFLFLAGVMVFQRTERTFVDTV